MYFNIVKNLALPNKYTNWYLNICKTAQNRANNRKDAKNILGNTEKHHILPKSFNIGGEKDKQNFSYLSIHEHFVVHHLLTKMFLSEKYNVKMIHALTQFCMGSRKILLSSRQIAIAMAAKHTPCSVSRAQNISNARLSTPKINCIHCNKQVDPGNHTLFHGNNCKLNPDIDPTILLHRSIKSKNSMKLAKERGTQKNWAAN